MGNNNGIQLGLRIVVGILWIGGFLLGVFIGTETHSDAIGIAFIAISFLNGLCIYCFTKIIELLENINNKLH